MKHIKTPYIYLVEMYNHGTKVWIKEKRYYCIKQECTKFPDNDSRRNFRYSLSKNITL